MRTLISLVLFAAAIGLMFLQPGASLPAAARLPI